MKQDDPDSPEDDCRGPDDRRQTEARRLPEIAPDPNMIWARSDSVIEIDEDAPDVPGWLRAH
jgi:hypothetical protein